MSINVKIDNSGAGVAQARIGSILYVGALGQLKEDQPNFGYDENTLTFTFDSIFLNSGWSEVPEGINHYFMSGTWDGFRIIHFGVGGGISISSVDPTGDAFFRLMVIRGSNIFLTAKDAGSIVFSTDNSGAQTDRWSIVPAGHLAAMADNTYDIGGGGVARPRNVYVGTNVITPWVTAPVDNLILFGLGTGAIVFATNFGAAVTQVQINHTASATRHITLTGSNGGSPTIGTSAGNLAITPSVDIAGVSLAVGTSPATSGVLRVPNSTFVTFRNAANNGNIAAISVNASDQVVLSNAVQDIKWDRANIALGGGAAPTVGTIGGSGPAAAAQRNWLRFIESDGTASFIPVWR